MAHTCGTTVDTARHLPGSAASDWMRVERNRGQPQKASRLKNKEQVGCTLAGRLARAGRALSWERFRSADEKRMRFLSVEKPAQLGAVPAARKPTAGIHTSCSLLLSPLAFRGCPRFRSTLIGLAAVPPRARHDTIDRSIVSCLERLQPAAAAVNHGATAANPTREGTKPTLVPPRPNTTHARAGPRVPEGCRRGPGAAGVCAGP